MKILYIEDTQVYIRTMERITAHLGYDLLIAKTAAEGLNLAMQHPDLIIVDMQLPDMDGLALVKNLREAHQHTPIVALTARVFEGEAERCLAAGCTMYIPKPIEVAKLMQLLSSNEPQ